MNPNITSLGGVCSVLLGVLSAVAGLDYFGSWGYGAIGLWILTVALTMARQTDSHFPAALGYLGIVAAVVHWLVPIAFLARMPFLFYVVAAAGGIVITAWYIWLGVLL